MIDTTIPLIDYITAMLKTIDDRFKAADKKATSELVASDRAIQVQIMDMNTATKLALENQNRRMENTNEWRGTVTDMLATMLTRREWEAWKEKIETTLDEIKTTQMLLVSMAEYNSLKDKVNDLNNKVTQSETVLNTKASSKSQLSRDIVTGITLFITIVSFLIMIYKLSIIQ